MASSTGFYPDREADQCEWLENLGNKCAGYTGQLGSTAGEMAQVKAVCLLLCYVKGPWVDGLQKQAEAAVAFRNAIETGKPPTVPNVPPVVNFTPPAGGASPTTGLLTWLFTVIARWKTAPGCSEPIMIDLGIKGTSPEASTQPPDISAKVDGDIVKVRVIKSGNKGYLLQSRVQGDTGFTDLGITTAATFEDKRPVKTPGTAEWREYRAKFWDGTEVSGAWSEVVRVTVEG